MKPRAPTTTPSLARKLTEHVAPFDEAAIDAANKAWHCTCGPVAIACILGLTLDQVRPLIGSDYRGWMNPTQVRAALDRAGVRVEEIPRDRLYRPDGLKRGAQIYAAAYGLMRLQFAGPWSEPGVPPRVAYRHTHWVASMAGKDGFPVMYDINWGWMETGRYFRNMDELALETPRSTGKWWPTHIYEVSFPISASATPEV